MAVLEFTFADGRRIRAISMFVTETYGHAYEGQSTVTPVIVTLHIFPRARWIVQGLVDYLPSSLCWKARRIKRNPSIRQGRSFVMNFRKPGSRIPQTGLGVFLVVSALFTMTRTGAAAVPSPTTSRVDHIIIGSYSLSGASSGFNPCTPGATPGFDVYVRDAVNNPVPFATVRIIFAGTGTGIRPYNNQLQPMVTTVCNNHEIDVVADGNGHAVFVPRFGRWGEAPNIPVYADGVLLRNIQAASPDYNDDGAITLSDLSIFSSDLLDDLNYHARSDFDDCPSSKLGDFSFFAAQLLASSAGPVEPVCP